MSPRPITHAAKKTHAPKPCPTCYEPMEFVGNHHECVKHGEPKKP